MKTTLAIFFIIGVISSFCIFVLITMALLTTINDKINEYRHRRAQQNRFNNKPTAACYCVDCSKWNPENGECSDPCNSRIMADCWFCCFAEPKKRRDKKMIEKIDEKMFEKICEAVHNAWWEEKKKRGIANRPDMIPYCDLSEEVKEYDRVTVRAVLRVLDDLNDDKAGVEK